jgi:CRISPR-associated endonuclease/helicase Cas3
MNTMSETFREFFQKTIGSFPYAYQERLATGPCQSQLISIPTGLGKTAAVINAWLWNRQQPNSPWPRRLIYCLPMRTLVEQTHHEAEKWLKKNDLLWDENPRHRRGNVGLLMGGADAGDCADIRASKLARTEP